MPRLCIEYPGICLTTEEKSRKNLSQGNRTGKKAVTLDARFISGKVWALIGSHYAWCQPIGSIQCVDGGRAGEV